MPERVQPVAAVLLKAACLLLQLFVVGTLSQASPQEGPQCTNVTDGLYCSSVDFNFSRVYYSESAGLIFAGGTNTLFRIDPSTMQIKQEISLVNAARQQKCLNECLSCMQSHSAGNILFDECLHSQGKQQTTCLPSLSQRCLQDWVSIVQPVKDHAGKEFILTCSTFNGFQETGARKGEKNCKIRSTTDLNITTAEFPAVLTGSSQTQDAHISIGTDKKPGVDSNGHIIEPVYTTGHVPGVFSSYNLFLELFGDTFTRANFFKTKQLDVMERFNFRSSQNTPSYDFSVIFAQESGKHKNPNSYHRLGTSTFHVQYAYEGHLYIWLTGTGRAGGNDEVDHGAYILRYCLYDSQNKSSVHSLQSIRVACRGKAQLRMWDKLQTAKDSESTSQWEMREMTSAIELSNRVIASFVSMEGLPLESALCMYSKSSVKSAFDNNPGRNFGETDRKSSYFSKKFPTCTEQKRMTDAFVRNFSTIDYTVYQNKLQSNDFLSSNLGRIPLWTKAGVWITKIAFHPTTPTSPVIFAGTRDGTVFRLVGGNKLTSGEIVFLEFNELKFGKALTGNAVDELVDIQPLPNKDKVLTDSKIVVTTTKSMTKIPVNDCSNKTSCETCFAVDGNCGWWLATGKCTSITHANHAQLVKKTHWSQSCPKVSITQHPSNHTASHTSSHMFTCNASVGLYGALAGLSYTWQHVIGSQSTQVNTTSRHNAKITSSPNGGSILTLSNIAAQDGGQYRCVVTTAKSGTNSSNFATLNVLPYFSDKHMDLAIADTSAHFMDCEAKAYPPVEAYVWTHNGQPLTSSSSSTTTRGSGDKIEVFAGVQMLDRGQKLLFHYQTGLQEGSYRCTAKTTAGNSSIAGNVVISVCVTSNYQSYFPNAFLKPVAVTLMKNNQVIRTDCPGGKIVFTCNNGKINIVNGCKRIKCHGRDLVRISSVNNIAHGNARGACKSVQADLPDLKSLHNSCSSRMISVGLNVLWLRGEHQVKTLSGFHHRVNGGGFYHRPNSFVWLQPLYNKVSYVCQYELTKVWCNSKWYYLAPTTHPDGTPITRSYYIADKECSDRRLRLPLRKEKYCTNYVLNQVSKGHLWTAWLMKTDDVWSISGVATNSKLSEPLPNFLPSQLLSTTICTL